MFECHNGLIPNRYVVDHENDVNIDNKLKNLQLLTLRGNSKKYVDGVHHSHFKFIRRNRKRIRVINISNQEILYFDHMNESSKYLLIVNRSIYFVCNGITKSAISKKDGNRYMLSNMLHN